MRDPHRSEVLLSIAEEAAAGRPISDGCVRLLGEAVIELAQMVNTLELKLARARRVTTNLEKASTEGDTARIERAMPVLREAVS